MCQEPVPVLYFLVIFFGQTVNLFSLLTIFQITNFFYEDCCYNVWLIDKNFKDESIKYRYRNTSNKKK